MKSWIAIGVTALAFAACKKTTAKSDGATRGSEGAVPSSLPAQAAAAGGRSAFAAWMPADAAKLWEGAWSSHMVLHSNKKNVLSAGGEPVALDIRGAKATAFGGEKDQELGFALDSPCTATFSEPTSEPDETGTSYHTLIFVIENGALVVGSGAAGYRKGKTAVVCESSGIHIVDANGTCTTWNSLFARSEPNTCVWSQGADGTEVLRIGNDRPTVMIASGNLLKSEQFSESVKQGHHTRAKDFGAAKAKVTAEIEANDPIAQAKAKGGVAGKTDTVLSLIVTLSSDPSLEGKPIELTALFLASYDVGSSTGETTHGVRLVDGKDQEELALACDLGATLPPDGLAPYAKLTVKGTIRESFGMPELEGCTLAKAP